jgi:DNA-binding transcriptional MerR regulator
MAVKGLVDPIFSAISTKRDQIKLKDIGERLVEITEDIKHAEDDFTAILTIKTKLNDLKQTRSQILSVHKETDALLRESLQLIDQKIQEYQESHKENILEEISKNCEHIAEYMKGIDYLPQITAIYNTDLWKMTEQML